MASTHPTEEEYTAAMERHGSPAWTADDERVQQRWLARHEPQQDAEQPKPEGRKAR
jgi:hypothetical protein